MHKSVEANADVKTFHISGESNILADALSRGFLEKVSCLQPLAIVETIQFDSCLLQGGTAQNLETFAMINDL